MCGRRLSRARRASGSRRWAAIDSGTLLTHRCARPRAELEPHHGNVPRVARCCLGHRMERGQRHQQAASAAALPPARARARWCAASRQVVPWRPPPTRRTAARPCSTQAWPARRMAAVRCRWSSLHDHLRRHRLKRHRMDRCGTRARDQRRQQTRTSSIPTASTSPPSWSTRTMQPAPRSTRPSWASATRSRPRRTCTVPRTSAPTG